jgi:hypothetical protein
MNCKNCNQIATENFCANCGQSTKIDKINFPNFLKEFSDGVFQINKGFFYSMKMLFLSPGKSIQGYLDGKRKNHFKPIAYVFTLSTIYFLLAKFLGSETFFNDAMTGYANGANGVNGSEEEGTHLVIINWFAEHYAYTTLMLLPLFSLATSVAFLGSKTNYLEHFVLNAYIAGQQAIIYIIGATLSLIINTDIIATLTLFVSMTYAFFVFWQFFSHKSRISVILRFIFVYLLYLLFILIVLFLTFAIFTINLQ